MTTICFDGKTLAADKQCTAGGLKRSMTKVHRVGDLVVASTGDAAQGMEMLEWVRRGRLAAEFPASQRKEDDACEIVVIDAGRILLYERTPYPVVIEDPVFAMGSGRDFAIAALFCGVDARKAVMVAIQFDAYSGMGIDAVDLAECS